MGIIVNPSGSHSNNKSFGNYPNKASFGKRATRRKPYKKPVQL